MDRTEDDWIQERADDPSSGDETSPSSDTGEDIQRGCPQLDARYPIVRILVPQQGLKPRPHGQKQGANIVKQASWTNLFALLAVLAVSVFSPVEAGGKLGYGGAGYGGLGYGGLGYGGGVGVGSSVALLSGGPAFAKAVAGPAFLVRTVHHVNKVSSGGALVAHSGLGSGYRGGYGGYGGGYGGYGGGYGGYGGAYGGYGGGYGGYGGGYGGYGGGYGGYKSGYKG
nr:chorion class B protein L11-like [Dermacentor andersoni]